ncbi:MAG: 5-formyltetrahydrofolate cyclo-ligase [Candidatus Binataceae bacterium]
MAEAKKYVRRIVGEARRALSHERVAAFSATIQLRVLALACYRECDCVVLYSSAHNEVLTERIFTDALRDGRAICFPRLVSGNSNLSLVRVSDPAELRPGAFGVLEPAGAELMPPDKLGRAFICVPGVAFTREGQRLGRGGGHYDRLLADVAPQAVTAGLAYSFQVLDQLPEAPHDRRLGLIITESAVYANGRAPRLIASRPDQGGIPRCG